jgi:solute carrier family 5 (sodium-coupled monocarboxylate transporter), member 8/12
MILVSIGIIFQGAYEAGGVENVYTRNKDNDRLNFFQATTDPTVRVDTMSAWLGQFFISMSLFGCQQNFVQRYLSMKSFKQVKK